ncbi:uncharacterized, partial [Tachysurus ichikawai]
GFSVLQPDDRQRSEETEGELVIGGSRAFD